MGDDRVLESPTGDRQKKSVEADGPEDVIELKQAVRTHQECMMVDPGRIKEQILELVGEGSGTKCEEEPTMIEPDETEIEIAEDEYPDWYKEGQYDAAIIFYDSVEGRSDKDEAHAFKDLLERLVGNGSWPRLCMIDSFMFSNGKLQQLNELIEKSTFVFLFVTDDFIGDAYCQMQKDELIMTTIEEYDKRWKVIPVMPRRPKKRLPIGIKALNNLSLTRLDYLKDLVPSLNSITHQNIRNYDRYFISNMEKLFGEKQHLKRARAEKDERDLIRWISDEKKRRRKKFLEEEEEFQEKEALRKTGPRLQPTEIHIHANALQLGSNNELNYSHEAGNAIPPDEEATEYVLEDDIGAVQIGENNRKTVNREDDYDDVDTKVPTNDLSTDQRNDKAQIAKEEMEEANITLQPTPCDTPVPSLPSEDMPQLPQYAAAPANQAPENVGSLNNYGAGHMRPQNHPDVPHLRVAPPVARHYPAAAVPRYNAAHMPPHPAHWGRSSLRISGGRIVANPMLRMIQTNITTLREVQREARRINILV